MFPNPIKHDESPVPNTIGRNNMYLDIDGYSYGDTDTSGWWSGYYTPACGYAIYLNKSPQGPSIYAPCGEYWLIATVKAIAVYFNDDPSIITTPESALVYISNQPNAICVNMNYPEIITAGMVFLLDAGFTASYPRAEKVWYDVVAGNYNSAELQGLKLPDFVPDNKGSLQFDGTSQYAIVNGNADILSKTSYTKIVWFYVKTFGAANNLISGGSTGEHAFWLFSSNKLNAGHNGNWGTVVGTTALQLNTWYCGAVTFSSESGWKLYLNGNLESSSSDTSTFRGDGDINIASYQGSNLFNGRIALASVYDRVLTEDEILKNYNEISSRFVDQTYIVFEDCSIMQAEDGSLLEYDY